MRKYLLIMLIGIPLLTAGWMAYQQRGQPAAGVIRAGDLVAMPPASANAISREDTVQVLDILAADAARRGVWTYAVTSAEIRGGYLYASVAGFPANQDINAPWTLDQAIWLGSVIKADGAKTGTVQGDSFGAQSAPMQGGGSGYIFPWYKNTWAMYGELGVHDCGFSLNGWRAVDFFPMNDLKAWPPLSPLNIYASQSGEISYVCRDNTQISYRVGDLMYVHMQDNGMQIGTQITQGQLLGPVVNGTFSDTCGNAEQDENLGHVHFCFLPYNNSWAADGYTLDTQNGTWFTENEVFETADFLRATWQDAGSVVDLPSSAMGNNFWDSIVAALYPTMQSSVAVLPDHQMAEIGDRSTTILIPVLQLLWPFLSLFKLTWWAWALGIIAILETLRIAFAVVMWGKKVLPDIVGWFI